MPGLRCVFPSCYWIRGTAWNELCISLGKLMIEKTRRYSDYKLHYTPLHINHTLTLWTVHTKKNEGGCTLVKQFGVLLSVSATLSCTHFWIFLNLHSSFYGLFTFLSTLQRAVFKITQVCPSPYKLTCTLSTYVTLQSWQFMSTYVLTPDNASEAIFSM